MIRLGAGALWWTAVFLLQKFNWGLGVYKSLVLLIVLAAVPPLLQRVRAATPSAATPRAVMIVAALLLAAQAGYGIAKLRHPSLIDVATTTLGAGDTVRAGADPYAVPLDLEAREMGARFSGYKYLPLTIAAYMPAGAILGSRGIVLTNLVLHLATVALLFRLAAALGDAGAGWIAALLYLTLPLVPFQLFAKGVTELVGVVPMLAALLLVERSAALAGLCLGLSISAKLLPGALLLPCCLPAEPRARLAYGAGLLAGLLPILPFVLWDPGAFFDNILLFNFLRPVDATSWLFGLPGSVATLAHVALALFFALAAVRAWRLPFDLAQRCGWAVALTLATLLAGPAIHHNYQLWWLPMAAALLGVALAPRGLPSAAPAVYQSAERSP